MTDDKTLYSEHPISWNHYSTDNIHVRRSEHSCNVTACNTGTCRNLEIIATDLIIKY